MNKKTLSDSLALLTNLVVIAGLFVVVYEIKQNTQALENETDVAIYSMAAENRRLISDDPSLRALLVQVEGTAWEEFAREEQLLLLSYWSNELDRTELQYILYERNGKDLENIVFFERDLRLQAFKSFWSLYSHYYDPEFVEYFDMQIQSANE